MDSQVAHPQGQGYEQNPNTLGLHSVVEGGDNEHHHEKKSVLKKVKAKAKMLKDTITKHRHGHGHDHPEGHVADDHDLDEEDDTDEEVIEDPEIHGAPVFESVAIVSSVDAGRSLGTGEDRGTPTDARWEEKFGKPRVDLGRTRPTEEELLRAPANTPQSAPAPTGDLSTVQLSDPTTTFVHGMGEAERSRPTVNLARPGGLEEDPQSPRSRREPSNYQTKVTDPTASGGEDADVSPVVRSLEKMTVHDETEPKSGTDRGLPAETRAYISNIPTGTGSHDQFSPEPTSMDTDTASPGVDVTKPEAYPGDQTEHKPSSPGSYMEKLSSATSVIAEKAVSAKNVVAAKLGYGERESPKSSDATGSEAISRGEKPSDQSSYTGQVSSATSVNADKAMLAKNIVTAKLGYGERGDTTTSHNTGGGTNSKPHAHETTAASGTPPKQSSYTGAISAIADKAISAKETVASKLGYAKKEGETENIGRGGNQPSKEQGKGIAAAVTEKLSPVISKVAGSMIGQRGEAPGEVAGAQAQDKGVSVRGYLAEKLKPGEEDKALSEVISSALQKKKTTAEAGAETAAKVTESEEVKKQLGMEGEEQSNSPGKRLVDTVRGAVGSWIGKTDGDWKASQQPARHGESEAVSSAADEQHGGERRRRESSD